MRLNTTRDFDKIYKCADLLEQPAPGVLRSVLNDYATLAAAAKRLVEANRWCNEVRDVCMKSDCNYDGGVEASETLDGAWKEFDAALAEVEALLKEGNE